MKANSALDIRAAAVVVAAVLVCGGWFWWLSRHDNNVPFLSKAGPAEWIVYPKPPDTTPHGAMDCSAVFRRSFTVASVPSTATLSARTFRQGRVIINGQPVDSLRLTERDWKNPRTVDVIKYLRPGQSSGSVSRCEIGLSHPAHRPAMASVPPRCGLAECRSG